MGALRLVFAGTPEPALPSLRALLDSRHEVVAVLTRPDAPAGRGRQPRRSPVAELADDAGLEVLTPARPREPAFLDRLAALAPDCCPVVAYGALVPRAALDVPRHGWVNLHFSLLPAWRGAAPVQAALRHGDEFTGATTFLLDEGLDTGPVLGVLTEGVRPRDTAGELLDRLAVGGAALLVASLDGLQEGRLRPSPQPTDGVSLAPKVTVADARVVWDAPAGAVDRQVRACTPAPGAWTTFREERLKLGPVLPVAADGGGWLPAGGSAPDGQVLHGPGPHAPDRDGLGSGGRPPGGPAPGELRAERSRVLVGTASGPVLLGEVQPVGRRAVSAADWARGARPRSGERLG